MSKKWTTRQLMYDLVSRQSDTFTTMETDLGRYIFDLIGQQDYWKEHPELCGLFYGNDVLGRCIPWALRRGTTNSAVILSGHFDCVDIDCYGPLKKYALNPDKLKEEMKKNPIWQEDVLKDLEDDNWAFGRGVADMKGGHACILCELFKCGDNKDFFPELNILYIGVPDEESQGRGIIQAIDLIKDIKDKYGLDYKMLLNPEPSPRFANKQYVYTDGSVGKALIGIVCKGRQSHVSAIAEGLNSTLLASNIASLIDFNKEFITDEFGIQTTPPAILYMKDCKNVYDVSTPYTTDLQIHFPLVKKNNLEDLLQALKKLCGKGIANAMAQYETTMSAIHGGNKRKGSFDIPVMTYAELEEAARKNNPKYEEMKATMIKEQAEVYQHSGLIQNALGIDIMRRTIELSGIGSPIVVIGMLPPYVPPVNNHYHKGFDREGMIATVRRAVEKEFGLSLYEKPYAMGMSDNSYISCIDVESDINALQNMVTPTEYYDIPLKKIAEVSMPAILIGPWGKDFHTETERVYLPDIDTTTPFVLETIMKKLSLYAKHKNI